MPWLRRRVLLAVLLWLLLPALVKMRAGRAISHTERHQPGLSQRKAEIPAGLSRFEFSQVHMGTLFRIVLYARDQTIAGRAAGTAFDHIARLDRIMSDYNPASELMQLCNHAGGRAVEVSDDLFRVLAAAQELARRSDGSFDITAGPIVRLWRRARRRREMPDPERVAHARELVGFRNLQLDPIARKARLSKPGMLLDLGGIGKGDAADQALAVLRRYGIESALVAAGGDIVVGASPPFQETGDRPNEQRSARGWKIALATLDSQGITHGQPTIETPRSGVHYVFLHDCAISTSGEAEQHVDLAGVRYSHIVDPRTGMPVTGRRSVSVIALKGIIADSLATAVSVLGPERGLALIKATPGAGVLYVEETGTGERSFQAHFPAQQ